MVEDPSSLSSGQIDQLRLYESEMWKKSCRTRWALRAISRGVGHVVGGLMVWWGGWTADVLA